MPKEKAPRNRTIDTPLAEGGEYLARCIRVDTAPDSITDVLDKTILGDTFSVLPMLPKESADLIIADPPYNLRKSFNGSTFTKKSAEEYEAYTRRWLALAAPLLKPAGSIYVCCDWAQAVSILASGCSRSPSGG